MELQILRLIYDYSVNGKLADSKFIDKLIEIIVSSKNISDYVRDVKFSEKISQKGSAISCASYSPLSMEVILNYEAIQFILEDRSYYDSLFSSLEQILFRNLITTQIILHELEHAYQYKQADNKTDNSIEEKLIRVSFKFEQVLKNPKYSSYIINGDISMNDALVYALYNRKLYQKYYALNPTERLAQINSFKTILNSIEPIKEYIPSLYEFKNASLLEEMLKGYEEAMNRGSCPTKVYLFGTNQGKVWTEFDFFDQNYSQLLINVRNEYDLFRRLQLGLPISDDEYDCMNRLLKSSNKFNF